MNATEKILLAKLNKYKVVSNRDVFQLPKGKDVSFFIQCFDYLKIFFDDIEDNIELEERSEQEKIEVYEDFFVTHVYNF